MDGALIINKPAGITSHDVVARARKILQTKKIGHTGTLDPFATGVLVLLIGKATRLAQFLDKDEKEYVATVRLGFETDSGDLTGMRTEEVPRPKSQDSGQELLNKTFEKPSVEEIENVLKEFRGEILQTPPMFSAKKIEGKKLYELARKGIEIEREPVRVEIFELELLSDVGIMQLSKQLKVDSSELKVGRDRHDVGTLSGQLKVDSFQLKVGRDYQDIGIRVVCSAGTYIRTLAQDIGRKLKTGAHLSALRRTRAGKFRIEDSVTLEKLEEIASAGKLGEVFVSMNECVAHLPERKLNETELEEVKHGRKIAAQEIGAGAEFVRLTGNGGKLLGIGRIEEGAGEIHPKVVFV
jgi:tRNA pseudouridine55 synthase